MRVIAGPGLLVRRGPARMDVTIEGDALVVPPSVLAYLRTGGGGDLAEVLLAMLQSFPSGACLHFGWTQAEVVDFLADLTDLLDGRVDAKILNPACFVRRDCPE